MATEKIKVITYKNWKDEDHETNPFMLQDLFGVLLDMKRTDTTVLFIWRYNGSQEEKAESIKSLLSSIENQDNTLIITWAYVSKIEFPDSGYYDNDNFDKDSEYVKQAIDEGKKPIPFEEILDRESKLLESIGFIDWNNFVQYENSKAYIYGNSLGKEVIKYTNNVLMNKE